MEDELIRLEAENSELRRRLAALQDMIAGNEQTLAQSIDTRVTPLQAIQQLRTALSLLEQSLTDEGSDTP